MSLGFIRKLFFKTRDEKLIRDIKKQKILFFKINKYKNNMILYRFYLLRLMMFRDYILYKYSCEIHPEAIMKNVIFRHPVGIVMGGGTVIEDNVIIHQNVTFGSSNFEKRGGQMYGTYYKQFIRKNTIICTGAKILGDLTIGENCIIGANAVVTKDVPDGATVVGFNKIILK